MQPGQYPPEWAEAHRKLRGPNVQTVEVHPPATLLATHPDAGSLSCLVDDNGPMRVFRFAIVLTPEDKARLVRTGRFEFGVMAHQMPPIVVDSMQE